MKTSGIISVALASVLLAGALTGCGAKAGGDEAREIIVAVAPGFYPITYIDDD